MIKESLMTIIEQEKLRNYVTLHPETERAVNTIEKQYAARQRLALYGLKPTNKILLHGPSGCGKRMIAERLGWNTGLPLFTGFIESAEDIKIIYEIAHSKPYLIFIDKPDVKSRLVESFCNNLKDLNPLGLVVVTSRLKYSGNFDTYIGVKPLPKHDILELLIMTLSCMNIQHGVDWTNIVSNLDHQSAQAVVTIAQDAAKICVLAGAEQVTQEHLEEAEKNYFEANELYSLRKARLS
jgi:ATP-dependent 26S proteasome regulatory subunit